MRGFKSAIAAAVLCFAGVAGAQSQNPTDQLLDVLRKDHALVLATIQKIQAGEDVKQGISQLRLLLIPHMRGEEESLYPALQQASGAGAAREGLKEHQEAEKVLQEILRMDPNDPQFAGRLNLLKESLQAHIKNEEEQVVPMAARKMDSARLQKVLADFQLSKKTASKGLK